MPGQDQYVALPSGEYLHVPGDASDDQLKQLREKLGGQVQSDALTQQTQATAKAAGAPPTNTVKGSLLPMGENTPATARSGALPPGAADIEKTGQANENVERLQNRAMRSPTPFSNAVSVYAPVEAAQSVIGAKVGGYAGAKAAPYVGVSPEAGEVAGGGFGGLLGAGLHPMAEADPVGRLEAPEKANLPFGFKYRLKGADPYEEMGASAQYRDMGRDAMRGYRTPFASAQGGGSEVAPEGVPGSVARPARNLIVTPEEARARDQMFSIAESAAKRRGMEFAGGQVPAEGRKVPRYPTPIASEEYGGARAGSKVNLGEIVPPEAPQAARTPVPEAAATPKEIPAGGGKRFNDKPTSEYAGAKGNEATDQLTDLIVQRTGVGRPDANAQAENLILRAKSSNTIEAGQANRYINELFAAERRGRR